MISKYQVIFPLKFLAKMHPSTLSLFQLLFFLTLLFNISLSVPTQDITTPADSLEQVQIPTYDTLTPPLNNLLAKRQSCYVPTPAQRAHQRDVLRNDDTLWFLPAWAGSLRKRTEKRQFYPSWECHNGPTPQPSFLIPFGNWYRHADRLAQRTFQYAVHLIESGSPHYYTSGGRTTEYPKIFRNNRREDIALVNARCPAFDRGRPTGVILWEFPIMEGQDVLYQGGQPGLDRIIFSEGCPWRFCGVITHRGMARNGFHGCDNL